MAVVLEVDLPEGYDPRKAVIISWTWPDDVDREAENVTRVSVQVADELLDQQRVKRLDIKKEQGGDDRIT